MSFITSDTLLNALQWRYATKQFDPSRRVSDADWATIETALVLTPSSFGLQPWKFLVITDQAVKESLVPVSWGQRQLADASHVVVFCVKTEVTAADVDDYLARISEVRGLPLESQAGYGGVIKGFVANPPFGLTVRDWVTRQAYIALGNLMTSASLLGIDTCPMEGFDPVEYDRILGLPEQGLRSVVTATVGYRADSDKYATLPKVRFEATDVIQRI